LTTLKSLDSASLLTTSIQENLRDSKKCPKNCSVLLISSPRRTQVFAVCHFHITFSS